MSDVDTIYKLVVRNASDTADDLVVTSQRGDANPYISGAPTGDGTGVDDLTCVVTAASYTGKIVDPIIAGTSRLFTSLLEDAGNRLQLGDRRAAWYLSTDGGVTWDALVVGYLTDHELTSDIEWSITVGDPTRVEHNVTIFTPRSAVMIVGAGGAAEGATEIPCQPLPIGMPKGTFIQCVAGAAVVSEDVPAGAVSIPVLAVQLGDIQEGQGVVYYESLDSFFARWPNRGCVFGGPVRGGFGPVADRGGWEMRHEQTGYLKFVGGYIPPAFKRTTRVADVADTVNAKLQGMTQLAFFSFTEAIGSFSEAKQGAWPGLIIEVIGHGYFTPTFELPVGGLEDNFWQHLVHAGRKWQGVFIAGGADLPVSSAVLRVRAFTAEVSDLSPIYWDGHPVDLIDLVEQECGNTVDAAARESTRAALGADLRIAIRIAATQNAGQFLAAIRGPFRIGVRPNAAGAIEMYPIEPQINTPPAVTITNDDVQAHTIKPFALDTSTAIRKVTIAHTRLVADEQAQSLGFDGSGLDGFVTQDEQFERTNNDPGAIGTGEQTYTIPGMVHMKDSWVPDMANWATARAAAIFDRRGRGLRTGGATLLRGAAGDALKLGDEALFAFKQLPNHNKRLLDDPSVAARAMQIAHITPLPAGAEIELIDSGPNAQPIATLPVLAIAASADNPRTVAEVTITNAADLNAAGLAVRLQRATTTGGAPAAGAYTDVAYFAAGQVPTTAIVLAPVFAGRSVYARGRSEQNGSRPSNYSAGVHVDLGAIPAPTDLTAQPDSANGTRCPVTWAPGTTELGIYTDLYIRLAADDPSVAVRVETLLETSKFHVFDYLTPETDYVAGVQHRDVRTNDVSALVEVAFTTSAALEQLDTPLYPRGFSGRQDPRYGFPQQDGVYGMVVAATEFPGFVDFYEAVETAQYSGVYGDADLVQHTPSVLGDWTRYDSTAPNDGLRRQLYAIQVAEGATSSDPTEAIEVLPWTAQHLDAYSVIAQRTSVLRVTSTESSDGNTRIVNATVGDLVDHLQAHYRLASIDETEDVDDFSDDAVLAAEVPLVLRPVQQPDGSRLVTFNLPQPQRGFLLAAALIPFYLSPAGAYIPGATDHVHIGAAPPAINIDLRATLVGALVSVSAAVKFGVSDGPVSVAIIQTTRGVDATLLTRTLSAPGSLEPDAFPELADILIAADANDIKWRAELTDVSGDVWTFGPVTALPPIVLVNAKASEDTAAKTGTVTVNVTDNGSYLDAAATDDLDPTKIGAITWHVTRLGTTDVFESTTTPAVGTSGVYTFVADQDPLHPITVRGFLHPADGSTVSIGEWTFDSDKIADAVTASVANDDANATATLRWDTDALIGVGNARYTPDGGATYVAADIDADLVTQSVIARTALKQTLVFEAKNAVDGSWGNPVTVEIDAYISESPSLEAHYEPIDDTHGQVVWSCPVGIVTLTIDGVLIGTPPASPIAVTLDDTSHSYAFVATNGDRSTPAPVTVPALAVGAAPQPIIGNVYITAQAVGTDTITVAWTPENVPSGAAYDLLWSKDSGVTVTTIGGVATPYLHQRTGTGGHGWDIVSGGTIDPIEYSIVMRSAAGAVIAQSAWREVLVDHA